jgi:predicted transcriptional regulator
MSYIQLHKAQITTLYALRHRETARFSDLMRLTDLGSDAFKFHLKKLTTLGHVAKQASGQYALTATGKEFANNLSESQRTIQKQPKLSVLLIVANPKKESSAAKYLFQKRARNPYYGFWSCIGGPVQWGEEFEESAARELKKQTNLTANFAVRMFYRKKDYAEKSGNLLEDKLFVVLEATDVRGELANTWHGGLNQWMTVEEFEQQEKHFESACEVIKLVIDNEGYVSRKAMYSQEDY